MSSINFSKQAEEKQLNEKAEEDTEDGCPGRWAHGYRLSSGGHMSGHVVYLQQSTCVYKLQSIQSSVFGPLIHVLLLSFD